MKKTIIRYIFSVAFVVLMLLVSVLLDEKEWIFPEVVALSIGMIVIDKRVWEIGRIKMIILFVLMSIIGTVLALYSPFSLVVNLATSVACSALLLMLFKTNIYPLISAGALPLVLNMGSWLYPVVVLVLCSLLASLQYVMEQMGLREKVNFKEISVNWKKDLRKWAKLILVIILCSIIPTKTGTVYFIVPPLIVTLVELSNPYAGVRKYPVSIIFLLMMASLFGVAAHKILHIQYGFPIYVSAPVALIALFVLFEIMERRFAPAAAIAVLPTIINQNHIEFFPIEITISAITLVVVTTILFKKNKTLFGTYYPICKKVLTPSSYDFAAKTAYKYVRNINSKGNGKKI